MKSDTEVVSETFITVTMTQREAQEVRNLLGAFIDNKGGPKSLYDELKKYTANRGGVFFHNQRGEILSAVNYTDDGRYAGGF